MEHEDSAIAGKKLPGKAMRPTEVQRLKADAIDGPAISQLSRS
jgi:hypothetical protein